jgi:chromosome condensin MukBEF MukE localization factor
MVTNTTWHIILSIGDTLTWTYVFNAGANLVCMSQPYTAQIPLQRDGKGDTPNNQQQQMTTSTRQDGKQFRSILP